MLSAVVEVECNSNRGVAKSVYVGTYEVKTGFYTAYSRIYIKTCS
jgi:hypothetical protein